MSALPCFYLWCLIPPLMIEGRLWCWQPVQLESGMWWMKQPQLSWRMTNITYSLFSSLTEAMRTWWSYMSTSANQSATQTHKQNQPTNQAIKPTHRTKQPSRRNQSTNEANYQPIKGADKKATKQRNSYMYECTCMLCKEMWKREFQKT